ncbi:hypothetical protein BN2497_10891 [Janthinobacterium sp. CG23_2]|nr:hypothetical protein BN2497_10891 [Janthinobacterium sp. CG23_2]CUU31843.1 hypothetical protein BN3177_10891 [Janthinobacterium sp. CG23_2]
MRCNRLYLSCDLSKGEPITCDKILNSILSKNRDFFSILWRHYIYSFDSALAGKGY